MFTQRRWRRWYEPFKERVFERGDLKYVILDLVKDKPRHGYEIIRALEERFNGWYAPSPGAVYPTLQMLEDMGYLVATEQEGKKVYTITDEGRKFLEARRTVVNDIRERMSDWWTSDIRHEVQDIMREFADLARPFARRMRRGGLDAEKLRRVREVITRARHDIESILEA